MKECRYFLLQILQFDIQFQGALSEVSRGLYVFLRHRFLYRRFICQESSHGTLCFGVVAGPQPRSLRITFIRDSQKQVMGIALTSLIPFSPLRRETANKRIMLHRLDLLLEGL